MEQSIRMNAVAFQEGDVWVVQGIQYNLVAMARSVQDIPTAFVNVIIERLLVAEHLGVDPFQGIAPAHDRFHKMFEAAVTEVKPTNLLSTPMTTVRLA